ncbi:MAG: methionyl-tRNA formyltransferase [Spirochaetales bacterium]|nr:methionyl-tRNA formyltransferase [Spirochaetales bacterium]
MRILFAGTPDIAVPSLKALARNFTVCGVLTSPDRASGRGRHISLSPVKEEALALGLPVLQPERINADFRSEVTALHPDVLAVVAFSKIFGPKFLSLFPFGGINLHPSLLPAYRGPSPLQTAILNGDTLTGITLQKISLEMDAGDILLQKPVPLTGSETSGSLTAYCAQLGADMMVEAVSALERGTATPLPQDHANASYCRLITKHDGIINWSDPAEKIERQVRAYDPWPVAHTFFKGSKLSILAAATYVTGMDSSSDPPPVPGKVTGMDKKAGILIQTGQGTLSVSRLQLQAKKAMDFQPFLNGVHDFIGSTLGGEQC